MWQVFAWSEVNTCYNTLLIHHFFSRILNKKLSDLSANIQKAWCSYQWGWLSSCIHWAVPQIWLCRHGNSWRGHWLRASETVGRLSHDPGEIEVSDNNKQDKNIGQQSKENMDLKQYIQDIISIKSHLKIHKSYTYHIAIVQWFKSSHPNSKQFKIYKCRCQKKLL